MNARPKKQKEEKRESYTRFRVTPLESEELQKLAKFYNYSNVSEYIRRTSLGHQKVDRKDAGLD